ncbi:phospholipid binding protein [Legionella birminghamensis]|uniref:Phospholipid binding protein n=1 Tax=Legionella birminghamensis TaxID=28083 RepID=A0A378IB15_9GAMM|nr:BON domain-containing protein [Legionella birminghamensis]KTC76143.1 phospholipid binding protein [Legionella birminghamensis]STX32233.1 phospholipid binding protein [Legionella birminghamensis]
MKKFCIPLLTLSLLAGCQSISGFSGYNQPFLANSDEQISNAIRTSFSENEILEDAPIQISSDHGVVTLSGYVKKIRQADVAEQIASQVNGVKTVENRIIIRK